MPPDESFAQDANNDAHPEFNEYFKPSNVGGVYWKFINNTWLNVDKDILKILLRDEGFSPFYEPKAGEVISPLESKIAQITTCQRVFYAGPLAGYKQGIYEFQGEPALVTKSMNLMEPIAGRPWPTLAKYFENTWNDLELGYDQRHLLFGWWKHYLESLHRGIHSTGPALALAGEHETGKTLLSLLIIETAGKRFAKPYAWMTGKDNFNEEMSESSILLVDDETADNSLNGRNLFGANVKQIVASPGARIRGLHQKATTLLPIWRLIICVNLEPDRVLVLPPLEDDMIDKIIIFKAQKNPMPMPARTIDEKALFRQTLSYELPGFVHFLLNEYVLPDELLGRFGVTAWHHPEVRDMLRKVSAEQQILEFIERYFKRTQETVWKGTTAELVRDLVEKAGLTRNEENAIPASMWLGRRLGKLAEQFPEQYESLRANRGTIWTIRPIPDDCDLAEEEETSIENRDNVTRLDNEDRAPEF